MRRRWLGIWLVLALVCTLGFGSAAAHITPPVVLVSERQAVVDMTRGASKFFVREVRLTPEEREAMTRQTGWRPEDDVYRFYLGRNDAGQLLAAVIFLTEYTIHGPVRVAVALGPDGKVKDATVVELTEETYPWLKPLLDQDFTREYVGRGGQASFGLSERFASASPESMPRFYGQLVASLIQRATVLFETAVIKRGG